MDLLFIICCLLLSFQSSGSDLRSNSWPPHLIAPVAKRDPGPATIDRAVYLSIVADFSYFPELRQSAFTLNPEDFAKAAEHPYIDIVGDGQNNGNVRIHLSVTGSDGMVALVEDYGVNNPMVPPQTKFSGKKFIRSVQIGTIKINNQDIIDPSTGKGIVADVWSRDPSYKLITHNCVDFANDLLKELKLSPGPDFETFYRSHRASIGPNAETSPSNYRTEKCPLMLRARPLSDPKGVEVWTYDVENGKSPSVLKHIPPPAAPEPVKDFTTVQKVTITENGVDRRVNSISEIQTFVETNSAPEVKYFVEQAKTPNPTDPKILPAPDDPLSGYAGETAAKDLVVKGSTEVALVRSGGITRTILSVAKGVLVDVGGVVATALLPIFVILDLINGQWAAAALGAIGGVLGIAAGLLVSGPIGLFVGAAIGIFFSIFPGLFTAKSPPPTDNPAKIIQFAFFGDKDHTGNEGCNAQRKAANQPQNCTAVFGAGTISKIFGWSIFDAIVFLIVNNAGQQMSIVDMGGALPVKDYTISDWSKNQSTYIDCGPGPAAQPLPGYNGGPIPGYRAPSRAPSGGYDCAKPKFVLNRALIRLPALGDTADKIYNRIIPAPGGDCKLLSDPTNGFRVPFLDVLVTGRPVGIACNLTVNGVMGIDPNQNYNGSTSLTTSNSSSYSQGTVLVYNPFTNTTSNSTARLPGSNSTGTNGAQPSGSNSPRQSPAAYVAQVPSNNGVVSTENSTLRAYQAPPPPTAFLRYNDTNAICFSGPNQYLCAPNGTYDTSDGSLGFLSRTATGVSFPPGAELNFSYPFFYDHSDDGLGSTSFSAGDQQQNTTVVFWETITNGSPRQAEFKRTIAYLASSFKTYNAIVPNTPPGVCLFDAKEYKGNFQCFGVGGTNFSEPIASKAKSLSLKGRAGVWLYSGFYGDLTAKYISTDVPDLTAVEDGSVFNFANRIKGMWIAQIQ